MFVHVNPALVKAALKSGSVFRDPWLVALQAFPLVEQTPSQDSPASPKIHAGFQSYDFLKSFFLHIYYTYYIYGGEKKIEKKRLGKKD